MRAARQIRADPVSFGPSMADSCTWPPSEFQRLRPGSSDLASIALLSVRLSCQPAHVDAAASPSEPPHPGDHGQSPELGVQSLVFRHHGDDTLDFRLGAFRAESAPEIADPGQIGLARILREGGPGQDSSLCSVEARRCKASPAGASLTSSGSAAESTPAVSGRTASSSRGIACSKPGALRASRADASAVAMLASSPPAPAGCAASACEASPQHRARTAAGWAQRSGSIRARRSRPRSA